MSNERVFNITRPQNFDECNSCVILSDRIEEAKKIDTHTKLNRPLTVEEIDIRCTEEGSTSTESKEKHVEFVPSVFMNTRVRGMVHFDESAK